MSARMIARTRALAVALLMAVGWTREIRAQDRSLHWRSITVDAVLDADGRLNVRERQVMVFTGDWNGGERRFDVRPRQGFDFHRLVRVDSVTRTERPLSEGDLSEVDNYGWTDGRTLRWRSRQPGDPFFNNTALEYVLDFSYSNILVPRDGQFVLNHDFAFADRVGDIETFELNLRIDPAWRALAGFEGSYRAGPLPPGRGFVVTVLLEFLGAGQPAGVAFPAGALTRSILAALLLTAVAYLLARLFSRERALGRFAPLDDPSVIDESWLREHVLRHRPEVVGAAWDDSTGSAEVAAVLARLVSEGKLSSEVRANGRIFRREVLALRRLVPRSTFNDYEGSLIDALFIGGSDWTDTLQVREHYKKTGFDPAGRIRGPLKRLVKGLHDEPAALPAPPLKPTLFLCLAAVVLLAVAVVRRPSDGLVVGLGAGIGIAALVPGLGAALRWRSRVASLGPHALGFIIPMGIYAIGLVALLVTGGLGSGPLALAGLTLFCVALWSLVTNLAASRDSMERMLFRRRLAAARAFFSSELRQEQPRLRDEWFPYLIGFGLAKHMDKWFRAFGGTATRSVAHSTTGSSSGSLGRSSGSGGWTGFGGGGGFSGGGASASWAAAASGMAAGVSAPSSGGSGGGGSGGGSSGGGGGGGW